MLGFLTTDARILPTWQPLPRPAEALAYIYMDLGGTHKLTIPTIHGRRTISAMVPLPELVDVSLMASESSDGNV